MSIVLNSRNIRSSVDSENAPALAVKFKCRLCSRNMSFQVSIVLNSRNSGSLCLFPKFVKCMLVKSVSKHEKKSCVGCQSFVRTLLSEKTLNLPTKCRMNENV